MGIAPTLAEIAERTPPTADEIVALGEQILQSLPEELRHLVGNVPVCVQDWPDEQTLDDMEIEDALDLTGLYRAVPLGERGASAAPPSEPEMIFLFRMPILFEWCTRACSLEAVVFDVLTHEIGHHFGMDENEVLRMEGRFAAD